MAAAIAPSHSHRSAGRSPAASPPLCGSRVRVDPAPACVVAASREADSTDKAASSRRRRHYRDLRDDDERPRRTSTSPSATMRRRRRRDADRDVSPDRRRRRRGSESASRAGYYRRDDDDDDAHHRRGRDVADHRVAKRKQAGGRKRSGRDRDVSRSERRSGSRSEERKAYPSAADDIRKPSPVKEVVEKRLEVTDEDEAKRRRERDELQRMREEFRRELDKVVRTVWFNDPYISPLCVLNKMPRWTLRTSSEVEEGEVV